MAPERIQADITRLSHAVDVEQRWIEFMKVEKYGENTQNLLLLGRG